MSSTQLQDGNGEKFKDLSGRERQILGLAAAGLLDKNIATELNISLNTLRTYWARIRRKCGSVSRPALTAAFVQERFPHPGSGIDMTKPNPIPVATEDAEALRRAAVYYATALHRVQGILQRAERALRVMANYPEALISDTTEDELIATFCKVLVDQGGYRMAWVGFPIHDEVKSIKIAGSYGCPEDFATKVKVTWGEDALGKGIAGATVRTGVTTVNQDFEANPIMKPWRTLAAESGFRSSIGLPLKKGSDVFAILVAYAKEPDAFDDIERSVLEALAADFAVRLAKFHTDDPPATTDHLS